MKLLVQRGQRATGTLPAPIFTLRVRAELDGEEEEVMDKYDVGNALLYEGNRKENMETAFGIAVISFIVSAALIYLIGFRVIFVTLLALLIAGFAFHQIYQRLRVEIYVNDLLKGKTFLCRSVVELMEKEKLIEELCLDFRQLLDDMQSWEGEEVVDVVPTRMQT